MSAKFAARGEGIGRDGARWRLPLSVHSVSSIALVGDFVLITAMSVLAGVAYHGLVLGGTIETWRCAVIGLLAFGSFAVVGRARSIYDLTTLKASRRHLREVAFTWGVVVAVMLGVVFSLKIGDELSRGTTFAFMVASGVGLLAWRSLLTRFVERGMAGGTFLPKQIVLIADHGELAGSDILADLHDGGYAPRSVLTYTGKTSAVALRDLLSEAISAAQTGAVAGVFVLASWQSSRRIDEICSALRVLPLPVVLLPDQKTARFLRQRVHQVGDNSAVEMQRAPLSVLERAVKRTFDVAIAACGLVLLSPLLLAIALLIKLGSRGPILFRQTRNGFNGRAFRILKFRTMIVLEDGPEIRQAVPNDARVTNLGRWLRRTSLDELPQLWNVLTGDMSIVGPRPHATAHNREYEKLIATYAYRQHVKPGLTGWAQVHGLRGETKTVDLMHRRVEYDLFYINHWNPWLDLRIIFRTAKLALHDPVAF